MGSPIWDIYLTNSGAEMAKSTGKVQSPVNAQVPASRYGRRQGHGTVGLLIMHLMVLFLR
jgi:hypothetical protein